MRPKFKQVNSRAVNLQHGHPLPICCKLCYFLAMTTNLRLPSWSLTACRQPFLPICAWAACYIWCYRPQPETWSSLALHYSIPSLTGACQQISSHTSSSCLPICSTETFSNMNMKRSMPRKSTQDSGRTISGQLLKVSMSLLSPSRSPWLLHMVLSSILSCARLVFSLELAGTSIF